MVRINALFHLLTNGAKIGVKQPTDPITIDPSTSCPAHPKGTTYPSVMGMILPVTLTKGFPYFHPKVKGKIIDSQGPKGKGYVTERYQKGT